MISLKNQKSKQVKIHWNSNCLIFDKPINETILDLENGIWEPWQIKFYETYIKPEFICIDVGANIGFNASIMCKLAYNGKVIAFEPYSFLNDLFQYNMLNNGITNVEVYKKALSNKMGTSVFIEKNVNNVTSHIVDNGVNLSDNQQKNSKKTQCRTDTLDNHVRNYNIDKVDLVKIDVEGYESQVLTGAENTIAKNKDIVFLIEFSPLAQRNKYGDLENLLTLEKKQEMLQAPAKLYFEIKKNFKFVFYLHRSGYLYPVNNLAELIFIVNQTYGVDDLVCTNSEFSLENFKHLIKDEIIINQYQNINTKIINKGMITSFNQDQDNWTYANNSYILGSSAGFIVSGKIEQPLAVHINEIYSKHSDLPYYPVCLYINDDCYYSDLHDKAMYQSINLISNVINFVVIETIFKLEAKKYLGNPNDPRNIGCQLLIKKDFGL